MIRPAIQLHLARPKLAMPALLGFAPPRPNTQLGSGFFSDLLGVDFPRIGGAAILAAGGVGSLYSTKILPGPFDTVAAIAGVGLMAFSLYELIESVDGAKDVSKDVSKIQSGQTVNLITHPRITQEQIPLVSARFIEPEDNATIVHPWPWQPSSVEMKLILTNDTGERRTARSKFWVVEETGEQNTYYQDNQMEPGANTIIFNAPITASAWTFKGRPACINVHTTTLVKGEEPKFPAGWEDQRCFTLV